MSEEKDLSLRMIIEVDTKNGVDINLIGAERPLCLAMCGAIDVAKTWLIEKYRTKNLSTDFHSGGRRVSGFPGKNFASQQKAMYDFIEGGEIQVDKETALTELVGARQVLEQRIRKIQESSNGSFVINPELLKII